jgi:hypothetical protein
VEQQIMKPRIFALALATAALGVVGCNVPSSNNPSATGSGTGSAAKPVEPRGETGGTGSSAAIPSELSHEVKADVQNLSQEQARTKRDLIYANLYKEFVKSSAESGKVSAVAKGAELNIPASFKADCKDVGKDPKFSSTNPDYKAFLGKPDVQQQCAQASSLDEQAAKAK